MPPRGARQKPGLCLWGYTDEFALQIGGWKLGPITVDLWVEVIENYVEMKAAV